MDKTTIFVISHKPVNVRLPKKYSILKVGSNKDFSTDFSDDTGDNIASKNPTFCELTGLYWIWKNVNSENIGLVHYRRFFTSKFNISPFLTILKEKKISTILKNHDLILPRVIKLKDKDKKLTVWEHYCKTHFEKDLIEAREVISDIYPEYLNSFDIVTKSNKMFMFNMFIGKKTIVDHYCKWLFDILFELEKRINITSYDNYQKRVFGFLAERLFNVWVLYNSNLKIAYYPFVFTDSNILRQNIINTIKIYRKK